MTVPGPHLVSNSSGNYSTIPNCKETDGVLEKKKYTEVYALVKSKFKDTKAKDDTNANDTAPPIPPKRTCRHFCFPCPLNCELQQSSVCILNGEICLTFQNYLTETACFNNIE